GKDELARDEHENVVAESLEVVGVGELVIARQQDKTASPETLECFRFRDQLSRHVVGVELHICKEFFPIRTGLGVSSRAIISTINVNAALDHHGPAAYARTPRA